MWWLAAAAWAHRPHVPVVGLAVDPDSGGEIVWAVVDIEDNIALMRSEDAGHHFDPVWSPVRDETVVDAAWAGDRLVVLAADGSVWTSTDGTEWVEASLPTSTRTRPGDPAGDVASFALATAGSRLAVASAIGVFTGEVDAVHTLTVGLPDQPIAAVAFSATDDQVVLAIDDEGGLWRSVDGGRGFVGLPAVADRHVYALAEYEGQSFAGTDYGVSWYDRVEASWRDCGFLPVSSTAEGAGHVPVLRATEDGRLLAATGQEALFVSDDDCESWSIDGRVSGVDYGAVGDATDPSDEYVDAWTDEAGVVRIVAGWNGVASSVDGGATWEVAKLIPGDYVRAVGFSPDWPEDPRMWLGGYGSGPYWTDDGGYTQEGSSVGNAGIYANGVSIPIDHTQSGRVVWMGNYRIYRSDDRGESWDEVFVPVGRLLHVVVQDDRWWALGEDGEVGEALGRVLTSGDAGATWDEPAGLVSQLSGASVRDVVETTLHGRGVILLAATSPAGVVGSFDGGQTWAWLRQGPEERSAAVAAWPPGDPTRLVFAMRSVGILLSDDDGVTWREADFPDQRPDLMQMADDGTLFVVTRLGQVVRSEDGGTTWREVGDPLAPIVHVVQTAPHFGVRGLVVLGTSDGIWFSPDRGDHLYRMRAYERWEDDTVHLVCALPDGAACPKVDDPSRGNLGAVSVPVGARLSFVFRGRRVRLALEGVGTVGVSIDGAPPTSYDVVGALDLDLPGDTWKDVDLEVLAAEGGALLLDGAETWGLGEPVPLWDWRCGCRAGTGAWSWWAAAAVWGVARRRVRSSAA